MRHSSVLSSTCLSIFPMVYSSDVIFRSVSFFSKICFWKYLNNFLENTQPRKVFRAYNLHVGMKGMNAVSHWLTNTNWSLSKSTLILILAWNIKAGKNSPKSPKKKKGFSDRQLESSDPDWTWVEINCVLTIDYWVSGFHWFSILSIFESNKHLQ